MELYYAEAGGLSEHEAALRLLEKAWSLHYPGPMPPITYSDKGKPFFSGTDQPHFSLSHSGGLVACALASRPCGCDIQESRPLSSALLRRCYTEEERKLLCPMDLWCLKECFVKIRGRMDRPYQEMAFLPDVDFYRGPDGVTGCSFHLKGGFTLAAAAEGDVLPPAPQELLLDEKTG